MARYRCPRCHELTYRPELFAFCGICSAPLSAVDLEPEGEEELAESAPSGAASQSRAAAAP